MLCHDMQLISLVTPVYSLYVCIALFCWF